jgi:hypothetical protein
MKNVTINIEGVSTAHFDQSVQEIKDLISGGNSSGFTTPITVFNIGGYDYTIDQNGIFNPGDFVGGSGPDRIWVDADGYSWLVSNDNNGALSPVRGNQVGGVRTFVLMINGTNIYAIGIDTNGNFEPKELI